MKDFISSLIIAVFFCAAGFLLGMKYQERQQMQVVGINTLIQEPITGSVDIPDPEETVPKTPELPVIRDTIYIKGETISIMETVDTAAIIQDYITERNYTLPIYEGNAGTITGNATVQYNKLTSFDFKLVPVIREIIYKEPVRIRPYIGVGFSSFNQGEIEIGAIKNHWGVGIGYVKDFGMNRSGVKIQGKYVF